MKKPLFIAQQSANPRGFLGRIVAKVMAKDTELENAAALVHLGIGTGEHILDFGCGHGAGLAAIASLVGPGGRVTGLDRSVVMVKEARRRNRALIKTGQVDVQLVDGGSVLPFDDKTFDGIMTMHTIYFISDLVATLRDLFRVTKQGGRLLVGFQAADCGALDASLPAEVYQMRPADEVSQIVEEAGFLVQSVDAIEVGKRKVSFLLARK